MLYEGRETYISKQKSSSEFKTFAFLSNYTVDEKVPSAIFTLGQWHFCYSISAMFFSESLEVDVKLFAANDYHLKGKIKISSWKGR